VKRSTAAILLLLATASCRHGADPAPVPVPIEFGRHDARLVERGIVVVQVGPGRVTVEGEIWTPQGGYELAAQAERRGELLRLEVQAHPTGAGITVPAPIPYLARLSAIPPGAYLFQVVHRLEAGPAEVVYEARIEVPGG
jgi:uncharacterized protein (DUF111 family)